MAAKNPEGAAVPSLPEVVLLADVARRWGIKRDTLVRWAEDPTHPFPPIVQMGERKKCVSKKLLDAWVRDFRRDLGEK